MTDFVFPVTGYRLVAGSPFDRGVLLRCLQASHQELRQQQATSSIPNSEAHIVDFIDHYLSPEAPIWWVEVDRSQTEAYLPPMFRSVQHPVGCIWLARSTDQLSGDRHTHILLLYVHPQHRRKGIGSALMQWAFTWAQNKGDRHVSLQVFVWNQSALKLYEKLGFHTQFLGMTKALPSPSDPQSSS